MHPNNTIPKNPNRAQSKLLSVTIPTNKTIIIATGITAAAINSIILNLSITLTAFAYTIAHTMPNMPYHKIKTF